MVARVRIPVSPSRKLQQIDAPLSLNFSSCPRGWLVKAVEVLPEDDLAAVERSVEILYWIADIDA